MYSFGFVDFASVDDAKKMLSSMNGQEIDGRQIKLDFAEERGTGELLSDSFDAVAFSSTRPTFE